MRLTGSGRIHVRPSPGRGPFDPEDLEADVAVQIGRDSSDRPGPSSAGVVSGLGAFGQFLQAAGALRRLHVGVPDVRGQPVFQVSRDVASAELWRHLVYGGTVFAGQMVDRDQLPGTTPSDDAAFAALDRDDGQEQTAAHGAMHPRFVSLDPAMRFELLHAKTLLNELREP